jgi:hypothetical protein
MANLTGVSNRNVFKAVAISSVVTPLTAIIGCLIVVHSFGLSGLQIGGGWGINRCFCLICLMCYNKTPTWLIRAWIHRLTGTMG